VEQEAREQGRQEGKLEAIARLIAVGLTVEQIADALELSIEQVQQVLAAALRFSQELDLIAVAPMHGKNAKSWFHHQSDFVQLVVTDVG
jgi:putative Mn2+ efflux pump MntP